MGSDHSGQQSCLDHIQTSTDPSFIASSPLERLTVTGCAAGKAKQAAKTEIEKMNLKEKECKDLIKEAAKIIYQVHDEVKDKMFELELSWVTAATGGIHQRVPNDVAAAAEKFAKEALEDSDDSDDGDMA